MSGRSEVLDLRTYRLKPRTGAAFERVFHDVLPLLRCSGIEVVAHGASLEDPDLHYLVRRFDSAAQRDQRLDAFYSSDEWRGRHRDAALALIESYHALLLPAEPIRNRLAG